jgi:GntR family transcriptional regulator / MocR family aminotransferase
VSAKETSSSEDQLAMAEFIVSGCYDRHIRTMRAQYRRSRESALSRQRAWRQLGVEGLDRYRHPEAGSKRNGLVIGSAAPAPSAW